MQDKLHDLSYQLSSANGLIYVWILGGVAIIVALIILFDPFKRRHKDYKYPWTKRRFRLRFNPFGFLFRRIRSFYRNLSEEMEHRRRQRFDNRD